MRKPKLTLSPTMSNSYRRSPVEHIELVEAPCVAGDDHQNGESPLVRDQCITSPWARLHMISMF